MSSGQESPSALLESAAIAYRRGDAGRAESLCRQLLDEQPGQQQASLMLGGLLLHRQAHEEAARVLAAALEHHRDHPGMLVNQSVALRGCGRLEESIAAARRAVEVDVSLVSAWNALGIALIESGRFREAEEQLRKGLTHHPDAPPLLHHLSQAVEAQGQHTQAMESRAALSRAGTAKGREASRLVSRGELGLAESKFREAIRLHPGDHASHTGLGCLLLRLGRNDEAIACLRRAQKLAPGDRVTRHFLAAALGEPPAHADGDYVRIVFDAYAGEFDQHLVEQLGYRVPEALRRMLEVQCPDGFGEVLDLGCGTGLVGEQFAPLATAMDGVDLSAEMLIKAREKNLYRDLFQADIAEFVSQAQPRWRTVVAADVFIYFGDVTDLFKELSNCMQPGGWLAFSVESSAGAGLELHPGSGRYRHGREYLIDALEGGNFRQVEFADTMIRHELGQAIDGWLVTARAAG